MDYINQHYKRILAAMYAVTNEDGVSTPTSLQINTCRALIKLTAKDYEAVSNMFMAMYRAELASRSQLRRYIRRLTIQAQCGALTAHFDYESGYMNDIANEQRTDEIDNYVRGLFALDSAREYRDEISELVDNLFTKCDDCGKWESQDEIRDTYHGESVCRRCIDYSYEWSTYHDNYVHTDYTAQALDADGNEVVIHNECDDFIWDEDEEMYVHRSYGGAILGNYHSSKSKFRSIESPWTQANCFYVGKHLHASDWTAKKYQRFFGVELEVEAKQGGPREHAEKLNEILNHNEKGYRCFFERDGSLSHGFEIITQPMGLDLHAEFWKWTQDKNNTKGLLSHNTSTCGLHVHVTKAGLTRMQLSKVVTFINHPDNKALIEAVARRYGSDYARFTSKKLGTAHRDQVNRYDAVNMEPNRTVEFRLFKGTLKYESLMSAIEFVNAVLNFCHDQSGYGFDLTTKSFMDYIEKPVIAHDTKHLRPYLINKLESQ